MTKLTRKVFSSVVAIAALVGIGFALLAYKERSRVIEGVLLHQFEGSNFFEGATPESVRDFRREDAGWLDVEHMPQIADKLSYGHDASGCWQVTAFELRFRGRKRYGLSGHLSAWLSEYEIAELLSVNQIDWPDCDSPYDWAAK